MIVLAGQLSVEARDWATRALVAMCGADMFLLVIAFTIEAEFAEKIPSLVAFGLIAAFLLVVAWALHRGQTWARWMAIIWFGSWLFLCLLATVGCSVGLATSGGSTHRNIGMEGGLVIVAFASSILGGFVGIALKKLLWAKTDPNSTSDVS